MEFWLRILTYTLPAGRVFGIPLRVNWLLVVFLPLLVAPYLRAAGVIGWPMALGLGAMFVLVLYGSILLHELGHGWGMRLLGETPQEIHLTPLGGVIFGGTAPASPRAELIVVGLGPAVSVVLAVVGWVGVGLIRSWWAEAPILVWQFFALTASINTMLALFNLLCPIFPLDSAKLVRAVLSLRFSPDLVTHRLAHTGIGLSIFLIVCSLFRIDLPVIGTVSIWLAMIAILGIQACAQVLQEIQESRVYETYQPWGARPTYYDEDLIARARRNAWADVTGWMPWGRGSGAGAGRPRDSRFPAAPRSPAGKALARTGARRGPARVVSVFPDPQTITDPEELRDLMQQAADAEDFRTAASYKKRLAELGG